MSFVVLQHTNNHCHPYIDSTTVLSDWSDVVKIIVRHAQIESRLILLLTIEHTNKHCMTS